MKKLMKLAVLSSVAIMAMSAGTASAKDLGDSYLSKERFQIRARMIGMLPDTGGNVTSAGADLGGHVDADNAYVPELDLTYFVTENVALELIAATTPHDLNVKGGVLDGTDLGDTMLLPPTLTLQYHFTPDNKFSPYVGAGVNYTIPYSEDEAQGLTGLDLESSWGWALQAGADYWLNDHWGVNIDVKKVYLSLDASVNNGAIKADAELDPLVVGMGVSYRF